MSAVKCVVCAKTAYPLESVNADGKTYHKTCFKCDFCHGGLKLGNYAALGGKFYCKPHFKQLFQLKGNYSQGFGQDKPTAKWDKLAQEASPSAGEPGPHHEEEPVTTVPADPVTFRPPPVTLQGLSMEQVEDAQVKFRRFDLDGNGTLDKEEFFKLLKLVMPNRNETLLTRIGDMKFAAADKDKNGVIDEVEFLVVYSDLELEKLED